VYLLLPPDEERREVALRTVKEGKLVMQGPMMLSQGYFGVVGRKPIYIANSSPNETFG
jgi:sensor domain CHASE-containing protein